MSTAPRQMVTLTKPQAEYLKLEAERLGITISEVIRRIIDQHREQKEIRS
jgi:hypothetical protein